MRYIFSISVLAISLSFINIEKTKAYDVAPGCTSEEFLDLFNADWGPDEIVNFCAGNIQVGEYRCWGGIKLQRDNIFKLTGKYQNVWFDGQPGDVVIEFDGETWAGTWDDPDVERSGTLYNFIVTERGFEAEWKTDKDNLGEDKNGADLPNSSGSMTCNLDN